MDLKQLQFASNKKIILVMLVITILFFIGLFLKPVPFAGVDSYSYLNYLQGTTDTIPYNTPIVGEFIFSVLPINELALQIILLVVAWISAILMSKIGEHYNPKYGWLAGALIFLGLFSSKIFFKLETDVFAIPMILASIYFILRYNLKHESYLFNRDIILSVIFIILAGLTWKFTIYFVPFLFLLSRHIYYIILFLPALIYFNTFIGGLVPIIFTGLKNFVSEQIIVLGVFDIIFLALVFNKKYRPKEFDLMFWIAVILAILNLKLSIILFFISIMAISSKINFSSVKQVFAIAIFLVIIVGVMNYIVYNEVPNKENIKAINYFEELDEKGYKKEVNWNEGYFYTYLTGKPTEHYGGYGKRILDYHKKIALTFPEDIYLENFDCNTIKKFEHDIIVKCN